MKQALRKEGKNITNWNCLHITISSMKMKNKEQEICEICENVNKTLKKISKEEFKC